MRVIAGIAKGRPLAAPRGARTRPTADRVKEALFSSLQPWLLDASVLDLFAGSGALGIEALSRGAARATFVERAPAAVAALRDNLARTDLALGATVVTTDVRAALQSPAGAPFDIVLLDPPYEIDRDELAEVLALLVEHLAPEAVVSVELHRRGEPPRWPAGMSVDEPRRYGDTLLHLAHLHDVPGA